MKRILCLVLALVLMASMLVACGSDTEMKIVDDGKCTILYDAQIVTSDQADRLANNIKKATGAEVTVISSSSFAAGIKADANTILLGNVAIKTSQEALASLRDKDYIVGVYGSYYIIGGTSSDAVTGAIQYFKNNVLEGAKNNGKLVVDALNNYKHDGGYDINNMTIGGTPIYECQIVIPQSVTITEQRFALKLQQLLVTKTGYLLEIVKKNKVTAEGQICIGTSLCTKAKPTEAHSFAIAVNGKKLELAAESLYGYTELHTTVKNSLLVKNENALTLDDSYTKTGSGAAHSGNASTHYGDVRLMFNNVWGGGGSTAKQRMDMLAELYAEYMPDVLGLQECSPGIRETGLVERLYELGYQEVPTDRNFVPYNSSETETRDPLFYRSDILELVDYGYQCLALEEIIGEATGQGIDAALQEAKGDKSKSVNWAIFRVKETGELFMAASVHLWWKGERAADDNIRIIQMKYMRNLLTNESAEYLSEEGIAGTMPIFIGGDYNSTSKRASLASMSGPTPFINLNDLLPEEQKITIDTHHDYPTYDEESGLWITGVTSSNYGSYSNSLDYIFVNNAALLAKTFELKLHDVLREEYAYLSSDHNAVYADISFTDNTPKQP